MRDVVDTFNPPLIPQGDEAVQHTTDDAASSKWSACNHQYFTDPYLIYFVKKPTRRAPLINRGYYARVTAIRKLISDFVSCFPSNKTVQVINLGAGLDTTSFWTLDKWENVIFYECDFPEIISRKSSIISRREALWSKLKQNTEDLEMTADKEIRTSRFKMVSVDLRKIDKFREKFEASAFNRMCPTLFLCECVLVYLEPVYSDEVIQWAANAVEAPSALVVYEQINPDDPFGRVMMSNLEARGCPLLGIRRYPTIASQIERYKSLCWLDCKIADMNDVYDKYIDQQDRRRIEKIEMFDEFEEWRLIQAHYIIVCAFNRTSITQRGNEGADRFFQAFEDSFN